MEAGARKAAVVVALVLIGAAVTALTLHPWAIPSPNAPPRVSVEAVESPPPPSRPGLAAAPLRPDAESESDEGSEMAGQQAEGGTKASGFRVTGTLKFTSGSEVKGDVELMLVLRDDEDVSCASTFNGSTFEIRVPKPGRYQIRSIEIDGFFCDPVPPDVDLKKGSTIGLVIEEPQPAVLQVLDAASGRPLPDAKAYAYHREASDDAPSFWASRSVVVPWPGTMRVKPLEADGEGLIRLAAAWGMTEWYVGAPAKAWVAVSVPHRGAEPLPVRLSPGGALRLTIPHWRELQEATIVIAHWDGSSGDVPPPDERGALLLDGVPTGNVLVTVRRGPAHQEGEIYGTAAVVVREGETSDLTVEAAMAAMGKPVVVRGTVTVPKAWGFESLMLSLEPIRSRLAGPQSDAYVSVVPDQPAPFAFDAVPPGRYYVHAYKVDARWETDVAEGDSPLDLVLSEPCLGEVRVTDAATGKAVEGSDVVRWGVLRAHEDGSASVNDMKFDADRGVFVFRAPRGRVRIATNDVPGYCEATLDAEMTPGSPVKIDMRLHRAATVVVRILLDGKPYVSIEECTVSVGPVKGGGVGHDWQFGGAQTGEMRIDGNAPGPKEVSLFQVEGFPLVEPQVVDLRGGETTEVVFVLKRKP